MIVDYFPFFAEYGVEILKLRYEMLKDYVDIFVVSESNKTHSGLDTERKFPKILNELNLPEEKFIYVETEIPETEDLQILDIDIFNSIANSEKLDSQRARARERLQKDALLFALDEFEDDDTVFIHSDMDEIIKPWAIDYLARVCRENQHIILKIPLVHCEARADLRIHVKETGEPSDWSGGMFLATKRQLKTVTPTQIRSGHQYVYPIQYVTENGIRCEDLGWHFSWMGDSLKRKIKANSWAHYNDAFSWMNFNSFADKSYHDFTSNTEFKDGSLPPSGNKACVLRTYPLDQLPKEIFEHKMLKDYFLPEKPSKLEKFPKVNIISTDDENGKNRSNLLVKTLTELNLNYKLHSMKTYPNCNTNLISNDTKFLNGLEPKAINIFSNHIRVIRDWYETTDDEAGFFCEDDLSFETVKYWDFSWSDFYNRLPENWDIIQMCIITNSSNLNYDLSLQLKLNGHYWGMNAYLLKRSYAKKILDTYCTDEKDTFKINFDYMLNNPMAIPEDLLYTLNNRDYYTYDDNGNTIIINEINSKNLNEDSYVAFQYDCSNIFVIPMVIENTIFKNDIGLDMHQKCHEYTLNLWKAK